MPEKIMRDSFKPHGRVIANIHGPSKTKQSFREESEINNILARYTKTGIIEHVAKHGGSYSDVPSAADFSEAMNLVTDAQRMFIELPAEIRSKFSNDPSEFLDFVSDPDNLGEMVEMGLAERPYDPAEHDEAANTPPPASVPETPPASPEAAE